MPNSRNWKALIIPSIDGKKTELNVSGEVGSGIVPPRLVKRDAKETTPSNVVALDVSGIAGGDFVNVNYQEEITGYQQYDIALVYNEGSEIEAALIIQTVHS